MIERSVAGKSGDVQLTFILNDQNRPVSVVGTFNEWNPHKHPMKRHADGTRRATVRVPVGEVVCFRYLAEGGEWFDDSDIDAYDHRGGLIRTAHLAMPHQGRAAGKSGVAKKATTAKKTTTARKPAAKKAGARS